MKQKQYNQIIEVINKKETDLFNDLYFKVFNKKNCWMFSHMPSYRKFLLYSNVAFIVFDLHKEDFSEILDIGVLNNSQNKGIGSILIDYVIRESKNYVFLEVASNNIPAINLYLKKGFLKQGVRKNYYNNSVDAINMRLDLSI